MTFSPDTLALFAQLLDSVQLNASAPDFEKIALQVIQARKELAAALSVPDKLEGNRRGTTPPKRDSP